MAIRPSGRTEMEKLFMWDGRLSDGEDDRNTMVDVTFHVESV